MSVIARQAMARELASRVAMYERLGLAATRRIISHAMAASYAALRSGQDPALAWDIKIQEWLPLLRQTMFVSHLQGMRVMVARARLARKDELSLAGALDGAVAFLNKALKLKSEELQAIAKKYDVHTAKVLRNVAESGDRKIGKAMLRVTKRGGHVREGIKELKKAFDAMGVTPKNSYTLEAVYRTQTQLAYSAGQRAQERDPVIQEILWGYEYATVGDDRVRPEHAALDGVRLPKDDPFWSKNMPPNGWGCRCQAIPIFQEEEVVRPPAIIEDDNGNAIIPGAQKGFEFNPGDMFPVEPIVPLRTVLKRSTEIIAPATKLRARTINVVARRRAQNLIRVQGRTEQLRKQLKREQAKTSRKLAKKEALEQDIAYLKDAIRRLQ